MLGALGNAGSAEKDQGSDRVKAYLMKVKKDLGVALEAGEISREDAAKRYEAAEKGIKERMAAGRSQGDSTRITREDWEGIRKRIEGAVESGRMTRAEADAKYRELREQMSRGEGAGDKRAEYVGFERRIRTAVAEGRTSPEDARARLQGMRKMIGEQGERGERGITVEEYRRAEAKMRKMVEDGEAKPEDVERRLIEMRKMIAGQSESDAGKEANWEGIKRRIEGAVKSGDMTREEADAKYKEIRERMAGRRER